MAHGEYRGYHKFSPPPPPYSILRSIQVEGIFGMSKWCEGCLVLSEGQVMKHQVRKGQVRMSQVMTCQVKTCQV